MLTTPRRVEGIFDRHRDSMEGPLERSLCQQAIGFLRFYQSALGAELHHGVQFRVDVRDPCQTGFDSFLRGNFLFADPLRQLGRRHVNQFCRMVVRLRKEKISVRRRHEGSVAWD